MRWTWTAAVCSCLVAFPAAAQPEAESFRTLVTALAAPEMEGRDAGTEGLARARDLLVDRFRRAGLQPGFHFGKDRGYTQAFDVSLGTEATRQTLQLLTASGDSLFAPGEGADFNAMGFSGDGWFEGVPVFLGYGIRNPVRGYDSYAGLAGDALAGKVAIVFRYEPHDGEGRSQWAARDTGGPWTGSAGMPEKARWAMSHGAEAVLVVDPPSLESNALRSTAGSSFHERMEKPVYHLRYSAFQKILAAAGRDPDRTAKVYEKRANREASPPDVLEGVTLRGDVTLNRRAATIDNVAALLPGEGALKDEVVVVGAHYDHLGTGEYASMDRDHGGQVHPGADDNASGTAALVLIAEELMRRASGSVVGGARSSSRPSPGAGVGGGARRAVLFVAFAGEERGLLGSTHWITHPNDLPAPLDNVVAMINLDMIGRLRGDRLFAFNAESSKGWPAAVRAAGEGSGLRIHFDAETSGFAMSDHVVFHNLRIPAVHFFTGVHEDYHRPTDTADRVNAEGGAEVATLVSRLAWDLATREDRLAFDEDAASTAHGHRAGLPAGAAGGGGEDRAYLGVMPNYQTAADGGGVPIAGVSPGSPAEIAGLRDGDVLVAWNDQSLTGLQALTDCLASTRPGEKVRITVRRGAETLTLDAELGRR